MGKKKRKHTNTGNIQASSKKRCFSPAKDKTILFDPHVLSEDIDGAELFFDLANADAIRYHCSAGTEVLIHQDRAIAAEGPSGHQTGGIVWETSFLLAMYLVERERPKSFLEVGAGCGLLGLVLCAEWKTVRGVLTDMKVAESNIAANIERNANTLKSELNARSAVLRWNVEDDREAVTQHLEGDAPGFILGTDVVFCKQLVLPLLKTLHHFAGEHTVVYLCLQTRCPDAHAALLLESPHFFSFTDASAELHALPVCGKVAIDMECHLFRLENKILK